MDEIKKYLIDTYGLPSEKIDQLLESAQTSMKSELDKAATALSGKDMDTLKKAAHTMKGSLRNLGLTAPADMAQGIENIIAEKNPPDEEKLEESLQALKKEIVERLSL